jgi:CHAT domain-containing protein/Tfp pilus assembly protein PilF
VTAQLLDFGIAARMSLVVVALAGTAVGCESRLTPAITLASSTTVEMSGRDEVALALTLPDDTAVEVVIDPTVVDVRARLEDTTGRTRYDLDAAGRALGTEIALIDADQPRTLTLRITGSDYETVHGTVRVLVTSLPAATRADLRRIAAAQLESTATRRRDAVDPVAAAAASHDLVRAASIYESLHLPDAAARAMLHAAGVALWSRWDPRQALASASAALRLAVIADARELEAHARLVSGIARTSLATDSAVTASTASAGEYQRADLAFASAARLYRELGLFELEALTTSYRGVAAHYSGAWDRAERLYERAGRLWMASGDEAHGTLALQSEALLLYERGELRRSIACFDRALAYRDRVPAADYAHMLHNSALPYQVLGDYDEALARYGEAMHVLAEVGDRPGEARALHGIGVLLKATGEPEEATAMLEQALALRPQGSDDRSRLVTLIVLGELYRERGDLEAARRLHAEAVSLASAPADVARTYVALARDELSDGHLQDARTDLQRVLSLPLPRTQRQVANAWRELGAVEERLGEREAAEHAFAEALAIHHASGSDVESAYVLRIRVRADFERGDFERVAADTETAIGLLEDVSARGLHADQRAVFLASWRDLLELRVDSCMALAASARAAGSPERAIAWVRAAFRASEGSRSVALLDSLAVTDRHVPSALLDRRRELNEMLAGKRARQDAMLDQADPDPHRLAELRSDITRIRAERDALEGRIGIATQSTRGAPGSEASLLERVPEHTLVAEYFLGARHSWLFLLDRRSLRWRQLPPADELEKRIELLQSVWSRPPRALASRFDDAADLARTLFEPLAGEVATRTFVIVPDGPMYIVPLAVLAAEHVAAAPGTSIEIAPSLTALATAATVPTRAPRLLAMVADPLAAVGDPRVRGVQRQAPPSPAQIAALPATRSTRALESLGRLPAAGLEAREILALVPAGQSLALLGADARRDQVLAAPLDQFRIIHFATHAWSDNRDPGLATLALSQFDADGHPLDGALRLADIAGLKLNADLVVLSGCETALGREIAGEGPVSLAQGFLRAGARNVLASLWQVPDTATATLMRAFYEQILRRHETSASALRLAQAEVRSHPRWSDPYYWAGFQLVSIGDPVVMTTVD